MIKLDKDKVIPSATVEGEPPEPEELPVEEEGELKGIQDEPAEGEDIEPPDDE